eukprot:1461203-Heterocapsa_arctica.AAC.1
MVGQASMECRVALHIHLLQGLPRKADGDPMLVATQDGTQVKVDDVLVHRLLRVPGALGDILARSLLARGWTRFDRGTRPTRADRSCT